MEGLAMHNENLTRAELPGTKKVGLGGPGVAQAMLSPSLEPALPTP